jgi:hypothetical protein
MNDTIQRVMFIRRIKKMVFPKLFWKTKYNFKASLCIKYSTYILYNLECVCFLIVRGYYSRFDKIIIYNLNKSPSTAVKRVEIQLQ